MLEELALRVQMLNFLKHQRRYLCANKVVVLCAPLQPWRVFGSACARSKRFIVIGTRIAYTLHDLNDAGWGRRQSLREITRSVGRVAPPERADHPCLGQLAGLVPIQRRQVCHRITAPHRTPHHPCLLSVRLVFGRFFFSGVERKANVLRATRIGELQDKPIHVMGVMCAAFICFPSFGWLCAGVAGSYQACFPRLVHHHTGTLLVCRCDYQCGRSGTICGFTC